MAAEGDSSWIVTTLGIGIASAALAIRQFFLGCKEANRIGQHIIVEAGEIADMEDVRKLARDFGPALEKLARIDMNTAASAAHIDEILEKIGEMERTAEVAKMVRDEVARTLIEKERLERLEKDRLDRVQRDYEDRQRRNRSSRDD